MNLLKCDDHRDTEIFYETSSANHFLPTIMRLTRITTTSSTLIDNLFTNRITKISGPVIIVDDI